MRGAEARDVIDRRHDGARGDAADRGRGREQRDGGVARRQGRDATVGRRDLLVDRRQDREQGQEFGGERVRQVERGDPLRDELRFAGRHPEAIATDERLRQRDVAGPRPDQRLPHGELRAHVPPLDRDAMSDTIRAEAQRLGQRAGVALVGLHPTAAGRVHRRIVGIRDDDRVPQRLEVARHPLTLRGRLEQNARRRPIAEDRDEALARRGDTPLGHGAVRGEDAELTLALVEIDPYAIHGWPPGLCLVARR